MKHLAEQRKLCVVMFTDIAGYTGITQRDEAKALAVINGHRLYLDQFTPEFHGQVLQFYGDGSLSIFESAVDAVRCAIRLQQAYRTEANIPVRIGIHLGDIMFTGDSVFGDGVNLAARIQAQGIAGSILISDRVEHELHNHPSIHTVRLGTFRLRNVTVPMTMFAITNPGIAVPSISERRLKATIGKTLQFALPVIVIVLATIFIRLLTSAQTSDDPMPMLSERIAVPEFSNLTNRTDYDVISKMAAHWITTDLIESGQASVVSYPSAVEDQGGGLQITERQQYAKRTGAINVIQGAFMPFGTTGDSLEFSATVLNLYTGEVLNVALAHPRCDASDPMVCIRELASSIKGYWESKPDHTLKVPKYDAYALYLRARDLWFANDEKVDSLLRAAIALDPDFIDAYFLMIDWHYDRREFQEIADLIARIHEQFPHLTPRQANYLAYYTADNAGRTLEAFQHFLAEYAIDPKDLFVNTSGMVMAGEYYNDPQMILEFFDEIPLRDLDLRTCRYCEERWSFAIHAYQLLGKTKRARELADQLKPYARRFQNLQRLVEFYVASGDTTSAGEVLRVAPSHLSDPEVTYLYFVAGRQAQLRGDGRLQNDYADQVIKRTPEVSRMRARALYLKEDLPTALGIYRKILARDSSDVRILGEAGLIMARLGMSVEAEAMVSRLDVARPPFDHGKTTYFQGRIVTYLSDTDRALRLLEASLQEGNKFLGSLTYLEDPDLRPLWQHPQFRAMIHRS